MEENWACKAGGNSTVLDGAFIKLFVAGSEELLVEAEVAGGNVTLLGSALVDCEPLGLTFVVGLVGCNAS